MPHRFLNGFTHAVFPSQPSSLSSINHCPAVSSHTYQFKSNFLYTALSQTKTSGCMLLQSRKHLLIEAHVIIALHKYCIITIYIPVSPRLRILSTESRYYSSLYGMEEGHESSIQLIIAMIPTEPTHCITFYHPPNNAPRSYDQPTALTSYPISKFIPAW